MASRRDLWCGAVDISSFPRFLLTDYLLRSAAGRLRRNVSYKLFWSEHFSPALLG